MYGPIFHLDYSENITTTLKFEPQQAHFSKQQISLHCAVMYTCSGNKYFYHLSDIMKYDSFFSNTVVKDLLNSIEDTVIVDVFRFKSNNCLT